MENIETILILESLAIKRSARLSNIATDRLLNGLGWPAKDRYTIAIEHDNICTDVEIQGHFRGWSSDVTELHFKRCEDSGVTECTCLAKTTGREDLVTF